MSTTAVYESIKAGMPEGLEREVLAFLTDGQHLGKEHAASKAVIATALLGKYTTTTDRMVRLAVSNLRKGIIARMGSAKVISSVAVPVLSNSGKAGYYLPEREADVEEWRRENLSRADELKAAVVASYRWVVPEEYTELPQAQQMGLYE